MAHYHPEVGTNAVEALLSDTSRTRVVSRLGLVEISSAFAIKVRSGLITIADLALLHDLLAQDIARGFLMVSKVTNFHWSLARFLIRRHASTHRLRAMDAIHLAIAKSLEDGRDTDAFVCSDKDLVTIARREGLTVINPLAG